MKKYEEQFERVERWYTRFQEITFGINHDKNTEYRQDVVYAFFINCYHLKDWILYDNSVKIKDKKQKIEEFINKNECMKLCADLCNGMKHLELNKTRTGKQPVINKREFSLDLGPKGTILAVKYKIETSTGIKDAFALAIECKEKWEEFIKKEIK